MQNISITTGMTWLGKPIVRFAAVGLLSTVIDIALLNGLRQWGVPVFLATAGGFLAGATNGYFLNSRFVFATQRSYQRYFKYFTVAVIGLLLTEIIIELLHVRTGLLELNPAKLVAVVVVFFWNFSMSKIWAFK